MPAPTGYGGGTKTLSKEEQGGIMKKLGNMASPLCTGAAKLYMCAPDGSSWVDTGIWGGVAVVVDRSPPLCSLIKLFDLKTYEVKFCQELYVNMSYEMPDPQFHTFESDKFIIGLSFADKDEATSIGSAVRGRIPQPNPSSASISESAEKKKGVEKLLGTMKSSVANLGIGKKSNKGMVIGNPTNFQHKQHIGYDPSKGFECSDIPEQWKAMFKSAGIRKKDLQNPEAAKVIYEVLQNELGGIDAAPPSNPPSGPPVAPPAGGPPAAPPLSMGGPPGPPPPLSPGGAPAAPSRAPLAPPRGGPPPPPPVLSTSDSAPALPKSSPPSDNDGGGRGDLLSAIRQGKSLKKVDPAEKSGANVALPTDMDESQATNLSAMLQKAMGNRFKAIQADDKHDQEEDDDWD